MNAERSLSALYRGALHYDERLPIARTSIVRSIQLVSLWSVFLVALLLLSPTTLLAQGRAQDQALLTKARAQNFSPALAAIVAGNLPTGEALLLKDNVHAAGTLQGDIESARRLTHAALVLRQQRRVRESQIVANRALVYLGEGKNLRFAGTRPSERAQVYELAAVIYERLFSDVSSAKAAYNQAKIELPSSKAADTGLARIQESEDRIARNTGKKG
jgi:hypothetical protein